MARLLMPKNTERDYGRTATTLLATSYVLLCGLVVLVIALVTSVDVANRGLLIAVCVGGVLFLWFVSLLLGDNRSNPLRMAHMVWLGRKRGEPDDVDYVPRVRRRRSRTQSGGNQPPTVEQLRELSDNVKTWVPSRSRAEQFRRKSER